jgi:hypothetical protein
MNIGETQATLSNPVKQDIPKQAIPLQRRISPK